MPTAHRFVRNRAQRVAQLFAGRIAIMTLQVGFMAITARILTPSDFGAYAASLVLIGFVSVLFSESIALSVVVHTRLTSGDLRWLSSVALAAGLGLVVILWIAAPLWASLWGLSGAVPLIRAMVVSLLPSPYVAILIGTARRYRRVGRFAAASTAIGSAGILIALITMLRFPSPMVLAIPAVLTPFALAVSQKWWLGLVVVPGGRVHGSSSHFGIALRDSGPQVLDFALVNAGAWAVGMGCGSSVLGMWNRASTLSQAPLMMLRSSISESLLEGQSSRPIELPSHQKHVPDFSIQLAVLGSAILAPLLYLVTPLLLGPQWTLSRELTVPLALYMGLLVATTRGTVLLRTKGRQGHLALIWLLSALPLALGIMATVALGMAEVAAWAYVLQGVLLLGLMEWIREVGTVKRWRLVARRVSWVLGTLTSSVVFTIGIAGLGLPMWARVAAIICGLSLGLLQIYSGGLVPFVRRFASLTRD